MEIKSAKDLDVYKLGYELSMDVFRFSRQFPPDEKYSLTDQIRRSSRSVCACLREAWAKRRYEAHFVSKLTDSDAENSETDTWLDFAKDSGYLSVADHQMLVAKCSRVGQMLGRMMQTKEKFVMH